MRCLLNVAEQATSDAASAGADDVLDRCLRLHPSVSLRPERFGALAYHFDTRKLSFLKHPDLVRVVESFDGELTVRQALDAADVDRRRWPSFVTALATLETSEMLEVVVPETAPPKTVPADAVENRDA